MAQRAFSEIRDVKIFFNDSEGKGIIDQTAQEAMSIDAYKAVLNKVAELESAYENNPSLANLAAASVAITGTSRYKLYHFTVTTTFASGEYTFIFVEEVPNADSLS